VRTLEALAGAPKGVDRFGHFRGGLSDACQKSDTETPPPSHPHQKGLLLGSPQCCLGIVPSGSSGRRSVRAQASRTVKMFLTLPRSKGKIAHSSGGWCADAPGRP
jgi:hypothetical protein